MCAKTGTPLLSSNTVQFSPAMVASRTASGNLTLTTPTLFNATTVTQHGVLNRLVPFQSHRNVRAMGEESISWGPLLGAHCIA